MSTLHSLVLRLQRRERQMGLSIHPTICSFSLCKFLLEMVQYSLPWTQNCMFSIPFICLCSLCSYLPPVIPIFVCSLTIISCFLDIFTFFTLQMFKKPKKNNLVSVLTADTPDSVETAESGRIFRVLIFTLLHWNAGISVLAGSSRLLNDVTNRSPSFGGLIHCVYSVPQYVRLTYGKKDEKRNVAMCGMSSLRFGGIFSSFKATWSARCCLLWQHLRKLR